MNVATPPTRSTVGRPAPGWMTALGRSETGGRNYAPEVEGRIPPGLRGSLYRNGPGLFERGGRRKQHLLDGDGLVHRLAFEEGGVRYRNAFVRTRKFDEEEAAGRYLYSTWSLRRPGGVLANVGAPRVLSQAGVTVYPVRGRLYAFDEVSPPWTLDSETLATLGPEPLGDPAQPFMIKAHTKFDPATGEWLLAGIAHGRRMTLHAIIHDADGALKVHHVFESPRQVYIHDFFATERHFVFVLHPMWLSPWRMLSGLWTYIESMEWRGEDGNLVVVLERAWGTPRVFEAPGAYFWHTLNAYEAGEALVADFVGYDNPDHFAPHDALLYRLLQGELGIASVPGKLRRYRIDLGRGTLREEILSGASHEFPMIDPRIMTRRHRVGYMTAGATGILQGAVKRVDLESGKEQVFDFGPERVAGEPVFAAKPDGAIDEGWLVSQVHDGSAGRAFFAVFDAGAVDAGPLAKIWLTHSLPLNFHGWWEAA